jgi:hypothetical protein
MSDWTDLVDEASARFRAVYQEGAPACRARGRNRAECARPAGHVTDPTAPLPSLHYGAGFDDWGPSNHAWEARRRA